MIELRRGRVLRIGHRGAAALGPENTLESIEAALAAGVDLIELDILAPGGKPVLAHDRHALGGALTLAEGLERLAHSDAGVLLDLKCGGCEHAVVDELRRRDFAERAVVASFSARSLGRLAAIEPSLQRAVSYPQDRLGIAERRPLAPFVRGGVAALRRMLPRRIGRWLERTGAAAASLHFGLVSRAVVERCHGHDAAVFAWTVNEAERASQLSKLGVDGIITDDPRIFSGWEA